MSPVATKLFALAGRFYRLANDETERLNFDDYVTLQEWETKLNAYGNLLRAGDAESFLSQELSDAKDTLAFFVQRLGIGE